jgi:hypothetical protein
MSNSCAPAFALVHCVMPGQGHPAVLPGSASLIAAGLGGAEALLDGDQVPRGQRPDPSVAARHVIGRLLDLPHVS